MMMDGFTGVTGDNEDKDDDDTAGACDDRNGVDRAILGVAGDDDADDGGGAPAGGAPCDGVDTSWPYFCLRNAANRA